MALAKVAYVVMVVCLVVLSALHETEGAVTCGMVVKNMGPCIGYLQKGGAVPRPCCGGIKSLASAAATPADRKTACNCLKSAARGIRGINFAIAAGLPGKCGVNIPYKISPSTDCSKVN